MNFFIRLLSVLLFFVFCNPEIKTGFYIQPYLQNVTPNSITILWWTDVPHDSNFVFYGQEKMTARKSVASKYIPAVKKYLHEVTIDGLNPETGYYYYVASGIYKSRRYHFRTAVSDTSSFHFVLLGDGRTDNSTVIKNHREVTRLAWKQHPDLAFHLGDEVYCGDQQQWDRFWRRIVTASDLYDPGVPFASFVPYYLVVGNHEIYSDSTKYDAGNLATTMARFKAYVCNPENNSTNIHWRERYYSFSYGAVRFIILDTNNTSSDSLDNHRYLPDGTTPDWEPGSEQYRWLEAELKQASRSAAFTFVLMHPAPYSRGVHGDPQQVQSGWQIRALDPLFRQYGVDAVFCSHDHIVERCLTGPPGFDKDFDDSAPENLNYFVLGNSGESARKAEENWQTWMDIRDNDGPPYYTRYFYDWAGKKLYSFLDVQITNLKKNKWQATFQIIRSDGQIFDRFSIVRYRHGR